MPAKQAPQSPVVTHEAANEQPAQERTMPEKEAVAIIMVLYWCAGLSLKNQITTKPSQPAQDMQLPRDGQQIQT